MSDNPHVLRDDLARVRHLGSAHSGTRAAWHMHLTSVALLPLTIGFVWLLLSLIGKPYAAVVVTLSHPLPAILMILFLGTGLYHMQLGMRTIIEDYVHDHKIKDACLTGNLFFAAVLGVACVYALLRLSLH